MMAGFECGRLEWQNNRCLLTSTDHVVGGKMAAHYKLLRGHGVYTVRDGLPWWLPLEPRLQLARELNMNVIWDLNHYWRHPDPFGYARNLVKAVWKVSPDRPFRVCFNETWIHPTMCPGQSTADVVFESRMILEILKANLPDVRVITAEPAHLPSELLAHQPFADEAEFIGLNFYPHRMEQKIIDMLHRTRAQYPGKQILITETGLHTGYGGDWARPDLFNRGMSKEQWLDHVMNCIAASGVPVAGVCVYPIVNGTDWHAGGHTRYDNGLIREDLTVDPGLSTLLRGYAAEAWL